MLDQLAKRWLDELYVADGGTRVLRRREEKGH